MIGLHVDKINLAMVKVIPQGQQEEAFNGLPGYYQGIIAAPSSSGTRKGQPNIVEWGDAHEKPKETVKAFLTRKLILRLRDPATTYFLTTDAQGWIKHPWDQYRLKALNTWRGFKFPFQSSEKGVALSHDTVSEALRCVKLTFLRLIEIFSPRKIS